MCKARRHLALAAALLPVWGVAAAAAQQAARYRAISDSLLAQWSRVRLAEQRRDSAVAAGGALDSVMVGRNTLLFSIGERGRAVAAAELAWAWLRPVLRGDTGLVAGRTYLQGGPFRRFVARLGGVATLSYDRGVSATELARLWVHHMEEQVALKVDASARTWTGSYVPLDTLSRPALTQAYRELLLSHSHATRECLAGDLTVCATVLGIRPVDNPAGQLLDPDERRDLVRLLSSPGLTTYRQCVVERDDDACLRELTGPGRYQDRLIQVLRGPLTARRTVLQEALRRGGEHAYARLMSARKPDVASYVEVVAGVPLDTLLTSWLAAVQNARPHSIVLTRKAAWTGFLWFVLLAVVVVRNTRWRLA